MGQSQMSEKNIFVFVGHKYSAKVCQFLKSTYFQDLVSILGSHDPIEAIFSKSQRAKKGGKLCSKEIELQFRHKCSAERSKDGVRQF